jgi:hypothetical protein
VDADRDLTCPHKRMHADNRRSDRRGSMADMKIHRRVRNTFILLLSTIFVLSAHSYARDFYTKIDIGSFTWASAINNAGYVTGTSGINPEIAFVRSTSGSIDEFEASKNSTTTDPISINDGNQIVGFYLDNVGKYHGFLRLSDGTIQHINVHGAPQTLCYGINTRATIIGNYFDSRNSSHGFIRKNGKKIETFDPPGSANTYPVAVTNGDDVAGSYYDGSGGSHAFVRSADGKIATFDVPGAAKTYLNAINSKGIAAGIWADSNGVTHFYVRDQYGTITTFDPPESSDAYTVTINNKGKLFGTYSNSKVFHGFERDTDGTIRRIEFPFRHGRQKKSTIIWSANDVDELAGALEGKNVDETEGFVRTR